MRPGVCEKFRRNLMVGTLACLSGYTSLAIAATTVPSAFEMINNATVPIFGVPLTVLLMATLGSLLGIGITDPIEPRKKLYFTICINTFFAAWFVILLPEWRGWELSPVAQPPLAGFLAACNAIIVPAFFKALPDLTAAFMEALRGALNRLFNRQPAPPAPTPTTPPVPYPDEPTKPSGSE